MDWRAVPSLAALRAFEAVARAGTHSGAARELNVTHAAIAQHIRALEAELNTVLLVREGRGMALTDTGRRLSTSLSDGFGQIIAGVRNVVDCNAERPIVMSVTPNFAENWLMPRFSDFWTNHPDIPLSIQPSMDVIDLRRDGVDLAVRYGHGKWPGLEATPLLKADYTVVAAPSLLVGRDVKTIQDLEGLPWLFEMVHKEARRWVIASGLDPAKSPINEVATAGMVMSAVRSGKCLTVATGALVADDIASGALVGLMQQKPKDLGYYIVHPKGVLSPCTRTVKSWLLSAV
jgi:LysR family glycine cleavage system transcriptional activator